MKDNVGLRRENGNCIILCYDARHTNQFVKRFILVELILLIVIIQTGVLINFLYKTSMYRGLIGVATPRILIKADPV